MALKVIILMLIALTAVKACGLDEILEDLYDDSESEEDSNPSPQNSSTQPPASTASSATNPTSTGAASSTSAPPTTTPPNSNSTSQPRARGKHRRHSVHRRRHLLRKSPTGNEGRDLYSKIDQIPYPARYAPNHLEPRNLIFKRSEIGDEITESVEPIDAGVIEMDDLVGQGRSGPMLIVPLDNEDAKNEGPSMGRSGINKIVHVNDEDFYKLISKSGATIYKVPSKKQPPPHKHSTIQHKYRYNNPPKHDSRNQERRPSLVDIYIINNYPTKVQNVDKNHAQSLLVHNNDIDENRKPVSKRKHVMVEEQNPRRPILTGRPNFYDEIELDGEPEGLEVKNPCLSIESVNEINRVKEHIIRESIKINPKDHSEVRNVEEKIRYSVIKSPCVPLESANEDKEPSLSEAIAHIEMPEVSERIKSTVDKHNMDIKGNSQIDHNNIFIQQLPLVNSELKFQKPRPAVINDMQRPDSQNIKEHKEESLIKHHIPYDIHLVDSNSGIRLQHVPDSTAPPFKVEYHDSVVQEKNIYVDPHTMNHHQQELDKYEPLPMNSNNNPESAHQLQHNPLISEYNVYGSIPSYPINNPEMAHRPQYHPTGSNLEHESAPDQPPRDVVYMQPPSADIAHNFKEPSNEAPSHSPQEQHYGPQNAHEHHHPAVVSSTSNPPKIINVL